MFGSNEKKPKKGAHAVHGQDNAPKPEKGKSRAPIAAAIAGGVVALLFLLLGGFTYLYPNAFPGVTVGSIPVSGMSEAEAAREIDSKSKPLYQSASVAVSIYEKTYEIPVTDALKSVDTAGSAANAMAVGRTGNPFQRIWQVVKAACGQGEAQLAATVDEAGLQKALADIAAEALTDPVEPSWDIGGDAMTLHAGKPGVKFDSALVEQALADKIRLMDFEPYQVDTTLTETPQIDLDKIGQAVIGEAVSAAVDKKDGKTIVPEKPGVQFDLEEAKTIVGDGTAASYTIPIKKTPAKVTAADLKDKLFRDTLAQTSTYLDEGNTQRTNNVRLAAKAINGTILNQGEEFSYNGVVGERTEVRGYKPAHAYVNGQIVDEFGGGVCQPSSTLYMAVLRADLAVVERTNHSFTVAYTPLGEDATVDYGNLDFRFKNSTDYPIKILAQQADGQLIMTLVGTKVSDKSVKTRTDVLATYAPSTVEKKDNSMTVGQTRLDQSGITGYSTRTYKVVTENGKTTETLANNSSYQKRDRIVYVGTIQPAPKPEPEPAPEPEPPETDQPEAEPPAADPEAGQAGGDTPAQEGGEAAGENGGEAGPAD